MRCGENVEIKYIWKYLGHGTGFVGVVDRYVCVGRQRSKIGSHRYAILRGDGLGVAIYAFCGGWGDHEHHAWRYRE